MSEARTDFAPVHAFLPLLCLLADRESPAEEVSRLDRLILPLLRPGGGERAWREWMGKERWIQSKVTSLPPPPLAFLHLGLGEVVFPPLWAGRHFYAPLYLSVPPQSWALGPFPVALPKMQSYWGTDFLLS